MEGDLQSINQLGFDDELIANIINFVQFQELPENYGKWQRDRFMRRYSDPLWHLRQGKLYYGERQVVPRSQVDTILHRLYYDPKTTQSSRDRLHWNVTQQFLGISKTDISDFLGKQETWQRHQKPQKPVWQPVISHKPRARFQMDLIDFQKYATWNNNFNWILTVIDCFSKHTWCFALKNKGAESVVAALRELFENGNVPAVIQSDNGPSEFNSQLLKDLLEEWEVLHSQGKAPF